MGRGEPDYSKPGKGLRKIHFGNREKKNETTEIVQFFEVSYILIKTEQ